MDIDPLSYELEESQADIHSLQEVRDWIVGVFQGEFNDEPTISQIIADGLISSVPVLGALPDIRDVCAILLRWYRNQEKMNDLMEWVALAGCALGLVPLFGGALKVVARLLIRYPAKLLEKAPELIAQLNRLGTGNAERWVKELRFSDYHQQVVLQLQNVIELLSRILIRIVRTESLLPYYLRFQIKTLAEWLQKLRKNLSIPIKKALDYLDEQKIALASGIDEIGSTTSMKTAHIHTANKQGQVFHTKENRNSPKQDPELNETFIGNLPLDQKNAQKWMEDNAEMLRKDFPSFDANHLSCFATAPEKISLQNRIIWRVYGPSETNNRLRTPAPATGTGGSWWGIDDVPQNAKEWREQAAVLDIFNADGQMVIITVVKGDPPALMGKAAQQKDGGQFLPGGGDQIYISPELAIDIETAIGQKTEGVVTLRHGHTLHFKKVNHADRPEWKDVNGKYGWKHQEVSSLLEYHTYALAPSELRPKSENFA